MDIKNSIIENLFFVELDLLGYDTLNYLTFRRFLTLKRNDALLP